jgi:hypothetical protein
MAWCDAQALRSSARRFRYAQLSRAHLMGSFPKRAARRSEPTLVASRLSPAPIAGNRVIYSRS